VTSVERDKNDENDKEQPGMVTKTDARSATSESRDAASRAPGAALDLRGLYKRYETSVAVDGISLDIRAGEFLTMLGPSGSGKTTTLNMIAGFVDVTEGEILMDGRPISELPPHRRDIGMVFQSYALFPHLTVFENIAFPLKRRKVRGQELRQRVEQALETVKLGELGSRYPAQLSGGQQQRVALARAIVFRPRVLLMDEPLGALDKKLREWLQLEIKRIHREVGITFVYVTHDQEEALVMSDRIAVFRDGRIEQVGTAHDLYECPRTRFVAEFLGESNVFAGRLEPDGPGRRVVESDGVRVVAPSDAPAGIEGQAAVVVRPERMSVCDDDATGAYDNVVSGRVRQVIYLGAARKLEVELADGRIVGVREQAGDLTPASEGDDVKVCWHSADGVLVAD